MKNVTLFIGLLVCIGSAQGQWQLAGFAGRNVACVAQHPQDTSVVLTAVADSLFQSTNGGNSWSFLRHFSGLPVNYVMYDSTYYDTVYALLGNGSYSDGIYRSTDGGYNWAVLEWMLCPRDMLVFYSLILVGCDGPGVFKSEDYGNTWIVWNAGLADSHVHAVDYCSPFGDSLADSLMFFFAGTSEGLFYRQFDSWIQAGGIAENVRVTSIDYAKSSYLGFATVGSGSWSDGIYRSTDYGQNWQVVNWWIYTSCVTMNPLWQSYPPNDTCGMFAGDSGLGVKYSSDCGTTWQDVNSGLGNMYVNSLSYHPQDSMRLFAATQGGLYRYQYGPGVVENTMQELNVPGLYIPAVIRSGMAIPIACSSLRDDSGSACWVRIFDVMGCLHRVQLLDHTPTLLTPIRQSGVYFVVVNNGIDKCRQKIIVID